jgi:hypothetical protein
MNAEEKKKKKKKKICSHKWRFPTSHRDNPSSHPFIDGIFHGRNHPAIGYPYW